MVVEDSGVCVCLWLSMPSHLRKQARAHTQPASQFARWLPREKWLLVVLDWGVWFRFCCCCCCCLAAQNTQRHGSVQHSPAAVGSCLLFAVALVVSWSLSWATTATSPAKGNDRVCFPSFSVCFHYYYYHRRPSVCLSSVSSFCNLALFL